MKITLVGGKGSGKDYLADLLDKTGYARLAWADALRQYCNEQYPNLEVYNTHRAKDAVVPEEWNTAQETPREIWERISLHKAQDNEKFFHLRSLRCLETILNSTDNIVITDTRNEYEYTDLVGMGFTTIYVTRPGQPELQGYDCRIKEFYNKIDLTYHNDNDGSDFIELINLLET